MILTDSSGRRRRRNTAAFALAIGALGCGGGGALDSGTVTGPGTPPESPAPSFPPASNVVTTTGTSFSPVTITIPQGASVTWQIAVSTHNVTFGTNEPTGGDVPNTTAGNSFIRTFPIAGTYPYECTLHSGMVGTVIVEGANAPVFTSVAVTPATPSIDVGATAQLTASALDQNGAAMAGLPAATWTSGNTGVATVNGSGVVTGVAAGSATITASMVSGGATRTGTATVTVIAVSAGSATVTTPNETFSPRVITIGVGSTVTWQFSGSLHNVTFGALKPTGGDIPNTSAGNAATRTFATAGNYDYECTRHNGMTGQVVVTGGAVPPPPPPPPANPGAVVQATPAAFTPERLEIAPGGTVTWEFSGGSFGIVFEEAAPPAGDIPESSPGSRVSRTFPTAGDYDYHSSKNREVQGRIRVR